MTVIVLFSSLIVYRFEFHRFINQGPAVPKKHAVCRDLVLLLLCIPIRIYLFSVDEPTNGSGRICFKAGAIEVNPIPQRVSLAFIAGNHRKPLGEANDGQTASVLDKFKWRRIHCDLTHKAARSGQFYFLQGHLVHTRRNDLKKCQIKF